MLACAAKASRPPDQLSDSDIRRLMTQPVREFITSGDMQEQVPAHSPIPQLLVNALEGQADPYGLGVVTGEQIAQYLWSQTRGMGISPREGKLPGGYFDRGEFLFRVGTTVLRTPTIAPQASRIISPNVVPRVSEEAIPADKPGVNYIFGFPRGSATPYAVAFARRIARDWTANGGASSTSIKLTCYGDESDLTLSISHDRAESVLSLLTSEGVARDAISVETSAHEHSVYSWTKPECTAVVVAR
jgi:hypothetical protein